MHLLIGWKVSRDKLALSLNLGIFRMIGSPQQLTVPVDLAAGMVVQICENDIFTKMYNYTVNMGSVSKPANCLAVHV